MSHKKLSISIATGLIVGSFAFAQAQSSNESIEFTPNSVIAYFSADGTLLSSRDDSSYYRYFKDIVSGCYLVQDFYSQNDQKQTDPICFTDPSELQSWFPQSMQGPLTFWDINGQKIQEGYSQQDGGQSGFWKSWESGKVNEYELINGELIVSYFDIEGNRQSTPSEGGTFRTLLDYNYDSGEYLVADYFTDSRSRQMDPVIIQRDDLLRWDIQSREGSYSYYNNAGELVTYEHYNNGLLNGKTINWYDGIYPAQKFDELEFRDGIQDGLYVRWYPNGYPKIKMKLANESIESIECWDDQFESIDPSQCYTLFDEDATYESNVNDDNSEAIEIIIPAEEISTYDSTDESATTEHDATVLFPHNNEMYETYDDIDLDSAEVEDENDTPTEPETEGKRILKSIQNIMNAL